MADAPSSVVRTVRARQVDGTPFDLSLIYHPAHPLRVHLAFRVDKQPVVWHFTRDMLTLAGDGEVAAVAGVPGAPVYMEPDLVDGIDSVTITLTYPSKPGCVHPRHDLVVVVARWALRAFLASVRAELSDEDLAAQVAAATDSAVEQLLAGELGER